MPKRDIKFKIQKVVSDPCGGKNVVCASTGATDAHTIFCPAMTSPVQAFKITCAFTIVAITSYMHKIQAKQTFSSGYYQMPPTEARTVTIPLCACT